MSEVAAIIADLVRAGVDADLVGRTAAALAEGVRLVQDPTAEKRRAFDRDRKAAKKASEATGIPPESTRPDDDALPPKETSPEPPKEITPIPAKAKRATRLPEDWVIPEEWINEAVAAGMSRQRAYVEADRMKNWSLSTKNGSKLNWHAAWRNWFQGKLDEQNPSTAPPKPLTLGTMWREEARDFGILNDPPNQSNRRVETRLPSGDHSTSGIARRIASAGSG